MVGSPIILLPRFCLSALCKISRTDLALTLTLTRIGAVFFEGSTCHLLLSSISLLRGLDAGERTWIKFI